MDTSEAGMDETNDEAGRRTDGARARGERAPWRSALHLVALASFAIAQPLFDVLQRGATFFVVQRSTPADVWVFTLALALAPGLVLASLALAVGSIGARGRRAVQLTLVGLLVAAVTLPPLRRALDPEGVWTLAPALLLGALGALAYARWELIGSFLDLVSPAPLLFAGLFLFAPGVRSLAFPASIERVEGLAKQEAPSAVFVVLDEFPLQSLLTPELEIDARLFPNFARLARTSTWLRNATASHESTEVAIPAILTGLLPDQPELLPTAADHPRSVFTMLAGAFRMRVWETVTDICPPDLAEKGSRDGARLSLWTRQARLLGDAAVVYGHVLLPVELSSRLLPPIDNTWGAFGRDFEVADPDAGWPGSEAEPVDDLAARIEAKDRAARNVAARTDRLAQVRGFIDSIDGSDEPSLYFLHIPLPHGPYVFLPSGRTYDPRGLAAGFPGGRLPPRPSIVDQQLQRHLLQLGCVDRLLGELLDRLEESGQMEDCALVLLADHGVNFAPGEYTRQAFKKNVRQIAHVPFFVKRPGQREARVLDHDVQTVDALPTLLDALGLESPWPLDGRSALDADGAPPRAKILYRLLRPPLDLESALPTRWRGIEQKLRLFGANPSWEDIAASGGLHELIGRRVEELADGDHPRARARLDDPARFENVAAAPGPVPIVVAGRLETVDGSPLPERVVVAVGGVVRAVAPVQGRRADRARFTALVPEQVFRPGRNPLELYALGAGGRLARLAPAAR